MDPVTGGALISGLKVLHDICIKQKDPKTMETLLEIQSQAFALVNENQRLSTENASLKEKLATKGSLEFSPNYDAYFRNLDNGKKDGPFCKNCWDKDEKLLRLDGEGFCTGCDKAYGPNASGGHWKPFSCGG